MRPAKGRSGDNEDLPCVCTHDDLEELRIRYASEPDPPCRVCGADLKVTKMGGGSATLACSSPEADFIKAEGSIMTREDNPARKALEHYRQSEVTQTSMDWGDQNVVTLIDAAKMMAKALTEKQYGEMLNVVQMAQDLLSGKLFERAEEDEAVQ